MGATCRATVIKHGRVWEKEPDETPSRLLKQTQPYGITDSKRGPPPAHTYTQFDPTPLPSPISTRGCTARQNVVVPKAAVKVRPASQGTPSWPRIGSPHRCRGSDEYRLREASPRNMAFEKVDNAFPTRNALEHTMTTKVQFSVCHCLPLVSIRRSKKSRREIGVAMES